LSVCLNCGADLHGRYCHACGQKAVGLHVGVHDFVHEATHEFLHLDGKILSTVKLLVLRPGQLTKEFIEGRRVRYITPLRLYLTFSVLFFALAALAPPDRSIVRINTDTRGAATSAAETKEAEHTRDLILHNIPRMLFVVLPGFALLTLLFYRKRLPYYVPHLYFAVHVNAFAFLLLSLSSLLGLAGRAGEVVGGTLFLAIVPYHYLALRRFFGESWPRTLAKGTAIGVLYLLMIAGGMGLLMFLILRR
jgi:uncharacterized protein DUF3667